MRWTLTVDFAFQSEVEETRGSRGTSVVTEETDQHNIAWESEPISCFIDRGYLRIERTACYIMLHVTYLRALLSMFDLRRRHSAKHHSQAMLKTSSKRQCPVAAGLIP